MHECQTKEGGSWLFFVCFLFFFFKIIFFYCCIPTYLPTQPPLSGLKKKRKERKMKTPRPNSLCLPFPLSCSYSSEGPLRFSHTVVNDTRKTKKNTLSRNMQRCGNQTPRRLVAGSIKKRRKKQTNPPVASDVI